VRPPDCVACGLPVLELVGQSATLPPYLIDAGSPPADTAGAWHLSCLRSTPVAAVWATALERSYVDVRQYVLLARTSDWSVLRNPRSGEVLALGHHGGMLPLHGAGPALRTSDGNLAYPVREPEYWLEWDELVIAVIQDRLRRNGFMPVLEVAAALGMDHRLSHPDVLAAASLRWDEELAAEWRSTMIGAAVDYAVHLPEELAGYYATASRLN
jgi:hypothetical protein